MRIKKITSQHRRDFQADYECQHCGHIQKASGYDDDHFHNNVVPTLECKSCGKTGGNQTPLQPKYPEGVQL